MSKETLGALYKNTEVSEKELLLDILENLIDSFDKEKANNFTGTFKFLIECDGKENDFSIEIKNHEIDIVQNSNCQNPYLEVECNFETFSNITLGKFNPITDILNGKINLTNGILSLPRFAKFGSFMSYRKIDLKLPITIKHPTTWIKPEKILLVNGSPRRNASTKVMIDWFKEGLPAGQVDVLDISSLKIGKCLHCFKCWTDHPNVCAIDDDAVIFRQKINEADLIVFFVPLSYATMPSDMKRALERLFPETTPFFYHSEDFKGTAHPVHRDKKPQAFLQFLVWGFPELKHGKILEENFNEWATHSHKNNLGVIRRPGVNIILGDPRLHFVRKKIRQSILNVANSVYNSGIIPQKDKAIIEKPDYVSIEDFHFYATNYWMKRFKTDYWN